MTEIKWIGLRPIRMVTAEPLPVKPVKLFGRNARTIAQTERERAPYAGRERRPQPNPGGSSD